MHVCLKMKTGTEVEAAFCYACSARGNINFNINMCIKIEWMKKLDYQFAHNVWSKKNKI